MDSPPSSDSNSSIQHQIAQALLTGILFAAPAWICLQMAVINDPDLWWHLRAGEWILQHHAFPQTDSFSSFAGGHPWHAYSWAFEVLIYKLFSRFGLLGVLLYSATMVSAITGAIFRLVRRVQPDLMIGLVIVCASFIAMMPIYTPRPWLFTVLFFAIEVELLMHARRTGKCAGLLWLPLIFAIWANIHIQFIDGLIVLGIALTESLLARFWPRVQSRLPLRWIAALFAACVLATLINPYGALIYKDAYALATQHGALTTVSEMQALPFRILSDYVVLFLALSAAFVLGKSRRFGVFEFLLLAFGALTAFRSLRDVWTVVIASAAIIAASIPRFDSDKRNLSWRFYPVVPLVTALVIALGVRTMHANNQVLDRLVANSLPVEAVRHVQAAGYQGPLFNHYGWGGFLMWSLRMPVSIDGRAALQGDDHIARGESTWKGEPGWASDPDLASAHLVIGPRKSALMQLLRSDARFRLAYEDEVADVFVSSSIPEKK